MTRLRVALLLLLLPLACRPPKDFGTPTIGPRGVVETPVPDYPFGDAVDVYRAVLDLLYENGSSKPSVVVVHDTAILRWGADRCPQCGHIGQHRSQIDTSLIRAFATIPPVRPHIKAFSYSLPIRTLSSVEIGEIFARGQARDSVNPKRYAEFFIGADQEFLSRFPGAWGMVDLSVVAFNTERSEALLEVRQFCGNGCRSSEIIYLRKAHHTWHAVERIPVEFTADLRTRLVYRGPEAGKSGDSQLLVDESGNALRSSAQDDPGVDAAVLDSLYSFYNERPRRIVISDQHAHYNQGSLRHATVIDSTTMSAFAFQSAIADRLIGSFKSRLPITVINWDSLNVLERDGVPLQREAELHFANEETTGLWLAFRKHFPGAWGYLEFSRTGYNPDHTQALVYSSHKCGSGCENGDVWLLRRSGEQWSIVERIPVLQNAGWLMDSVRYLGPDADPRLYKARRATGILKTEESGMPLGNVAVTFDWRTSRATVWTDSTGRFSVEGLPMQTMVVYRFPCPISGRADTVTLPYLQMTHPGLDTVADIEVPIRGCKHLNRSHPLLAASRGDPASSPKDLAPDVAGVYAGVLDVLYPTASGGNAPILIDHFPVRHCVECVDREIPRLVRQGKIDPSIEASFAGAVPDSAMPRAFPYRRRIEVFPMMDSYWLGDPQNRDWTAMKDAYPGVKAITSFGAVGFSNDRRQALVEVYSDSAKSLYDPAEVMLLKKTDGAWRVALRHVERETTSGEWNRAACLPADAPTRSPGIADLRRIEGDYEVVRVGTSRQLRGRVDTLRIRLAPLKQVSSPSREFLSEARVLSLTGTSPNKVASDFKISHGTGIIDLRTKLPNGTIELDGWYEEHRILRTTSNAFFGSWSTSAGPTVPFVGFFCARLIPR